MRIELVEAVIRFGERAAVGPFSLQFPGTGLAVVGGPNGAGKSVLLRLLAGVLAPTSGELLWDGRPARARLSAYKFRIGYMPQNPTFYEDQTAAGVLRYFASLKAIPARLVTGRVDEMLEAARLADLAGRRVKRLSGGERSRLALAVALLNDPDVLLLDEPGANLDPSERRQLWDLIGEMKAGRSVVMATHVFAGLEGVADRLVILESGRVLCDVPAGEALERAGRGVWEVAAPGDRIPEWREGARVVSRRRTGDSTLWRVLGAACPAGGAQRVPATLDDAYLWLRWSARKQADCGESTEEAAHGPGGPRYTGRKRGPEGPAAGGTSPSGRSGAKPGEE